MMLRCMQVLSQVAWCLHTFHKASLCHRAVHPSHVLWLPGEARWAMSTASHQVPFGAPAPLQLQPLYTAPELARELQQPRASTRGAAAADDAWALGVLAYEMLTGECTTAAVPGGCPSRDEVCSHSTAVLLACSGFCCWLSCCCQPVMLMLIISTCACMFEPQPAVVWQTSMNVRVLEALSCMCRR